MTNKEIYNNEGFKSSINFDNSSMKINEIYEASSNPTASPSVKSIKIETKNEVVEKDNADAYTVVNKTERKNYQTVQSKSLKEKIDDFNDSKSCDEVYTVVNKNK